MEILILIGDVSNDDNLYLEELININKYHKSEIKGIEFFGWKYINCSYPNGKL